MRAQTKRLSFLAVMSCVIALAAGSWGGSAAVRMMQAVSAAETPDSVAAYTCPMHPHIHEHEAGACPICGMDLVARKTPEPVAPAAQGFTCPMHPHIHESEAGSCPICGMDLVARQQPDDGAAEGMVQVESGMINSLGIKTTRVDTGTLYQQVRLRGYVDHVGEATRVSLSIPFAGTITWVSERKQGDTVRRGEKLLVVEAAHWKLMQDNYRAAVAANDYASLGALGKSLVTMGASEVDLKALQTQAQSDGLFILRAPADAMLGTVLPAVGDAVTPNQKLAALGNRYPIEVYADVFEGQWRWMKAGVRATMRLRDLPEAQWQGKVEELEELIASNTMTMRVRMVFEQNPEQFIRKGMQASITLYADPTDKVLRVPRSAVIRTGEGNRVIRALRGGRFFAQPVRLGRVTDYWAEIRSGLEAGDRVVVSGQFLLDSESSLRSELARMQQQAGPGP